MLLEQEFFGALLFLRDLVLFLSWDTNFGAESAPYIFYLKFPAFWV